MLSSGRRGSSGWRAIDSSPTNRASARAVISGRLRITLPQPVAFLRGSTSMTSSRVRGAGPSESSTALVNGCLRNSSPSRSGRAEQSSPSTSSATSVIIRAGSRPPTAASCSGLGSGRLKS